VESESTVTNSSAINDDNEKTTIVTKTQAVNGDVSSTVVSLTNVPQQLQKSGTIELLDREAQLLQEMEAQATAIVDEMMEESCQVDEATGGPKDELCVDEVKRTGFRATVKGYIQSIGTLVIGRKGDDAYVAPGTPRERLTGDELEKGCEWRCCVIDILRGDVFFFSFLMRLIVCLHCRGNPRQFVTPGAQRRGLEVCLAVGFQSVEAAKNEKNWNRLGRGNQSRAN